MAKVFRLGMIGLGNRVRTVLPGIYEAGGIEVYAVADPCKESLDERLSLVRGNPKVVGDYRELLAMPEVDGVFVGVPNYLHSKVAIDVLKAKKPLYLEKPMAISKAECDAIIASARETGTPMMVGMQYRYNPVFQRMKELCDAGEIGDIKMLCYRAARGKFRAGVDGWRMKKALSGGAILEVSVHQLDLFNWFAGAPLKKVAAFGGKDAIYRNEELLDNVALVAEYSNGVKANLQGTLFSPQGTDATGLCVIGEKGSLFNVKDEIILRSAEKNAAGENEKKFTVEGQGKTEANIQTAFRLLVQEGKRPLTSVEAGRDAVVFSMLCEESIETGKVIEA